MADDVLQIEIENQVAVFTLNRPAIMNSFNFEMLNALRGAAEDIRFNPNVRVVIITGAGEKAFCAGADLKERITLTPQEVKKFIYTIRTLFTSIESLNKPVIAAINGVALGGGMELLLAADIRIAAMNASMGLTEARLAIIPGAGGTQRLPRLIGRGKAKELIFTGRRVDAKEALQIGLVNKICEPDILMDEAKNMAAMICECGPIAIEQAKYAINAGLETDLNTGLAIESNAYWITIPTEDRLEGLAAFRGEEEAGLQWKIKLAIQFIYQIKKNRGKTMTETAIQNRQHWENEENKLDERVHQAMFPGGDKAIEKLRKQGKKPVRELIEQLIDPDTRFYELSSIAGFGMDYPGVPDVPCAGVVTGIGKIQGNWTMIFANDSRVKAGTYFPITLKKHIRAQSIAEKNGLNCVYIADSGGAFLPMQADVFPDDQHFGTMFYNMARMSANGLKQITFSTGGNTAGGAYIVFMACQSVMVDQMSYSFLGGPPLVKMATGEVISAEDLGGARVHTHVSGGADHFCQSQDEAIERVREILCLEPPQKMHLHRYEERPPLVDPNDIYDLLPSATNQTMDGRAILKTIADDSYFVEYKEHYAPGRGDNILAGKIRIKGIPTGIIASNKIGVIFEEAARKAAEWIVRCSHEKIPLIFLQGSPGYMIGSDSEHNGIGKYGSDMVRTVSCAQVPRIQMVIGPDNGAANYGMCGRAYRPNFLFTTMRGRTSVMSGRSAGGVLLSIEERKREVTGKPMTADEKQAFFQKMMDKYDGEAHPFFCGARILNDRVLKFSEIRDWLAMALEVSLIKPIGEPKFGNVRF